MRPGNRLIEIRKGKNDENREPNPSEPLTLGE